VPVTSPVISDFDNEAGLGVQAVAGPHGVWAMDVDGTPTGATGSFAVESCDTTGNGLHFKGSGFKMWGADVAAAFVSPTDPVDASKYQGISFVLKSAMPVSVIVKLTNVDSQPSTAGLGMGCGLCDPDPTDPKDCYSGFARVISSDATGTPQTIKWSDFPKQMWGFHFPGVGTVDPSSLEGISFSVDQSVASFDVCIDDVKFF
jgi:hypothetical protein